LTIPQISTVILPQVSAVILLDVIILTGPNVNDDNHPR